MAPNNQDVDTVDQVSSVTLLGVAVVGSALAVLGSWLLIG